MRNYDPLPAHLRAGMKRYIEHGIEPGRFLRACLENDLSSAVSYIDDNTSMDDIAVILRWLLREAPGGCWCSRDNVRAHIDSK